MQRCTALFEIVQCVPSIGVALRRPGLIDAAEAGLPGTVADLCMGPLHAAEVTRATTIVGSQWNLVATHLQPAATLCLRYGMRTSMMHHVGC